MSLRGFHIFFLTVVTLFFAGIAGWGWTIGQQDDPQLWKSVAWIGTITACIVPAYGIYFIKKAKHLYL